MTKLNAAARIAQVKSTPVQATDAGHAGELLTKLKPILGASFKTSKKTFGKHEHIQTVIWSGLQWEVKLELNIGNRLTFLFTGEMSRKRVFYMNETFTWQDRVNKIVPRIAKAATLTLKDYGHEMSDELCEVVEKLAELHA